MGHGYPGVPGGILTPAQLRTRRALLLAEVDVVQARIALAECPADRPELVARFERLLAGHRVRLAGMIQTQGAVVPSEV